MATEVKLGTSGLPPVIGLAASSTNTGPGTFYPLLLAVGTVRDVYYGRSSLNLGVSVNVNGSPWSGNGNYTMAGAVGSQLGVLTQMQQFNGGWSGPEFFDDGSAGFLGGAGGLHPNGSVRFILSAFWTGVDESNGRPLSSISGSESITSPVSCTVLGQSVQLYTDDDPEAIALTGSIVITAGASW